MSIDDPKILQEQAKKVRGFVDEVRDVPYLLMEELNYLLDKYESFLKKIYGDNCHQIRFLRRITFLSTSDKTKESVKMRIWYGGLNELILLSNTLLEEYGDEPAEAPIEYEEPEVEEDEIPDEEYFPSDEAAEIARRIKEVEAEEVAEQEKAKVKEKETIPETPPDLKELEKKVDVIADILTFIVNGFGSFLKGCWKVLYRLIGQPEKLFQEWKEKIAASMEYKSIEGNEVQDAGDQS